MSEFERIRIMVETDERTFRGLLYKPLLSEDRRLSDYLNEYDRPFICLSDVQVNDRGQAHRAGDKRDFVAISVSSITYITPLKEGEI
jgi:hypothetical protein